LKLEFIDRGCMDLIAGFETVEATHIVAVGGQGEALQDHLNVTPFLIATTVGLITE